ncbi:patatin-like phospholipase family protein [Aliidiomarina halalkaliphila]|uniref:Patatin-like phospholipase family protein n=1 Tax=Aliidiomarina halalkaliphila TaxID=2593535 RepID=A0A552X4K2_9GAMM|nr:patatin-like phospholipase family protein [Aliidiomarina halalkaliphila]TRW49952.1 patatin-like phospholipase family protein [Aliidiomarina halalkaliphila]
MTTQWIDLRAGSHALAQIQEHGLQPDDISLLLGASGGPKWFILQGLDNYLFGEFFSKRQQPMELLGTSAGAWRFASLGRSDAADASALFCKLYRATVYSEKPDVREITDKAIDLLNEYVTDDAIAEILSQDRFLHHMIVVRSRGIGASDNRVLQGMSLIRAAALNAVSRKTLRHSFERVVFHHPKATPPLGHDWHDLPTRHVALTQENFRHALLATGSIPMVLAGVRDIPGAPPGVYRDGGVTDYHFNLPFDEQSGLVLYPHFQREVIPGWFDKHLKRRMSGQQWPNVLALMPTQKFIDALPYQKIPDRHDFANMDVPTRQKFWQQAVDAGYRMADELAELISSGKIRDAVTEWKD